MERTYHATIDNGLFFLATLLNKPYQDITIDDIKQSSGIVSKMICKYKGYDGFKKNTLNGFQNSIVNNNSIKNEQQIIKHIKDMFDNIGDGITDDVCMFCGKKLVKSHRTNDYKKKPTRSYIPMISSMQFSNFINNFQIVNVCPICLYLSILSSFICTSYGNKIALILSDNDEVMEDIAFDGYNGMESRLLGMKKKFNSTNDFILDLLCNLISKINEYDDIGYIEMIMICNSSKLTPEYTTSIFHKQDITFIKKILERNLITEFKSNKGGLIYPFIQNKLKKHYTFYIIKNFMNISKDLFYQIEEVYCTMNESKIKLIEKICERIYYNNEKSDIKELERVSKLSEFENLLYKWSKKYKTNTDKSFFDSGYEYDILTNPKEFLSTKNRMLIEFMMLEESTHK